MAEAMEPDEIITAEGETVDESSDVLIQLSDLKPVIGREFECDNCGARFTCSLPPQPPDDNTATFTLNYCPACGAEYGHLDDSAVRSQS